LRGARRLTYADSRMKNLLLTFLHLAVVTAKLCGPGGVRAVIAENLLLRHQLIVLRRARKRAPSLRLSDRILCGFGSLFLSPERIRKLAIAVHPSTLMAFHAALVRRKYRALFGSRAYRQKPGPKGPGEALIRAVHKDILPLPRELSSLRRPSHVGGPPACPQGVERR
jgi:putative transposase